MTRVVIVAAQRTPFGRFRGQLARVAPVELATLATRAALKSLDPTAIDLLILGNVLSAGHGMNLARQVAIRSGLPTATPAYTVNLMCGSGLQAALLGVQAIRAEEARAVVVGGVESMSQAAFAVPRPVKGQLLDLNAAVDSLQQDGLIDSFSRRTMGQTVEDLAREYGITRVEQDTLAIRSHRLAQAAILEGRFRHELVPVGDVTSDESPRPDLSVEALGTLRTVFEEQGTLTAGNSSGVSDGAGMLVLAEANYARQRGWQALAEWRNGLVTGCDPQRMGLGPVAAIRQLLDKTDLCLSDFDTLEINEAFAAQALACLRDLQVKVDDSPLCFNPDGGALALGHPLAASGARLLIHTAWRIANGQSARTLLSLCIGGGMGIASVITTPAAYP